MNPKGTTCHQAEADIILAVLNESGGGEMKITNNDAEARAARLERLKIRVILAGLAIAGIISNAISHYLPYWLEPIAKELGTALIVSAVLGATVDFFFKEELARNAFLAAFRYVLPGEFKDEVAKILTYPFIGTDHTWKVKIEKLADFTLVTTTVEKK